MTTALAAVPTSSSKKPVIASGIVMFVAMFVVCAGIMTGELPFLVWLFDVSSVMHKWIVCLMMLGTAMGSVGCVIVWES